MVSTNTLLKNILNVKDIVIENVNSYVDCDGVKRLRIALRPTKAQQNRCPHCGKKCSGYDIAATKKKIWRGLDWNGIIVELESATNRIECPIHGVVTAAVPWSYYNSSFTKEFDLSVGWLATFLPRTAIAEYMRIDWATVGRCISRTLSDIEPERSRRLNGLVKIGIDETSYKKGHKYITVVVNHETNCVVWAAKGHGKEVLEQFYLTLTEEQRNSIQVVTADGARWIANCVSEYTPNCVRCIDPFHVVEWANEAVSDVRKATWREMYTKAKLLIKENSRGKGRPKMDDEKATAIAETSQKASQIKGTTFVLGKAPENLTEKQERQLKIIADTDPVLFRAYRLKEMLRQLLKLPNIEEAKLVLNKWLWWASHSRIPVMVELNKKIRRHKEAILNAIEQKMSNARIEATNNKIKLIIRKAYGFRNIQNMLDMIYLICSDLKVPLPNRNSKLA